MALRRIGTRRALSGLGAGGRSLVVTAATGTEGEEREHLGHALQV